MVDAAPAVPVALKVIGLPPRLPEVAVTVLAPAVVPSFQLPRAAARRAVVVGERPVPEPPPEATAKVTETPETGLPKLSVTFADGAVATFVFTVVLWPLPALTAIESAAPAVPVALKVTGLPARLPDVAVRLLAPAAVPSFQLP